MSKISLFPLILFILIINTIQVQAKHLPEKSLHQKLSKMVLDDIKKETMSRADKMLNEKPVTVTAAHSNRSAGGRHDFFSQADYSWPDPADPNAPYINKDGQSYPGVFSDHRHAMIRMCDITATLTSAWLITGKKKYADSALRHLDAWFADTTTMMNPNMLYSQAIWGRNTGRGIGIIDAYHLVEVARSAKLLIEKKAVPEAEAAKIKAWFSQFLTWMTTHQYGLDEMNTKNNHSTCWVATASSMASLVGDEEKLEMCRKRFKDILLPSQMATDGSFPLEIKRTKPYGYSLFNIDAFCNAAEILSTPQDNLWEYTTSDGKSLKKGLEYIYPFIADKTTWPFAKDIFIWEAWPVRQSCLLFGGIAYQNEAYIKTYLRLPSNPTHPEVIRNLPVRHPVIWLQH
jgi:hypothetical protein